MVDPSAGEVFAAADQELLRVRVTQLAMRMLDEFEDQLETGTPASRRELLKSAIPAMMKALDRREDVGEEIDALRGQVNEMFGVVRDGLLGRLPIEATATEKPKRGRGRSS